MPSHSATNSTSNSRSCEQVAGWKSEVQVFFSDDWSRLRTLIMDLEEKTWSDDSVSELGHAISSEQTRPLRGMEFRSASNDREQRPVAANRLSDLAAQIERRLRMTNGNGT